MTRVDQREGERKKGGKVMRKSRFLFDFSLRRHTQEKKWQRVHSVEVKQNAARIFLAGSSATSSFAAKPQQQRRASCCGCPKPQRHRSSWGQVRWTRGACCFPWGCNSAWQGKCPPWRRCPLCAGTTPRQMREGRTACPSRWSGINKETSQKNEH